MQNLKINFKFAVAPFLGGVVFSLGLGFSGMTEPQKIIGFLDIFGLWDPTLIFVMLGAIATHATLYRLVLRADSPLLGSKFYLPTQNTLDKKLIMGAALFGVGWGVTGLCPGPGIATLAAMESYGITFVSAMIGGMILTKKLGV